MGITPQYAILSHTWEKEEVTYQDIQDLESARKRKGFAKIEGACSLACDKGYSYIWIDTCCIDKSSSAELSEAINSMFTWYRESEICYAHLSDVSKSSFDEENLKTRWCTRGWTLQELLAPLYVYFFDQAWEYLGTRKSLAGALSKATQISVDVLGDTCINLEQKSIACRMSWMSLRETTRVEDMAYSLLGIFDINMPLLYGEGMKAFKRLQEEIIKVSNDQSLLAWSGFDATLILDSPITEGDDLVADPLADMPSYFHGCSEISAIITNDHHKMVTEKETTSLLFHGISRDHSATETYGMTGMGLQVKLPVVRGLKECFGLLACQLRGREQYCIGIPLRCLPPLGSPYFLRLGYRLADDVSISNGGIKRSGITLIPIRDAARATVETILIQRKKPTHGAIARKSNEMSKIVYHPFVAITYTFAASRAIDEPVLVLPVDTQWDYNRQSIVFPNDGAQSWAILVYAIYRHRQGDLRHEIESIVSILISTDRTQFEWVHLIEVDPPRHLNDKSDLGEWLKWANLVGVTRQRNYLSKYGTQMARLQNDPNRTIEVIQKEKRIYNQLIYLVQWDIRAWKEPPLTATGGYLRNGIIQGKTFHD